ARSAREHHDDRTGDDDQDPQGGLQDGGSAEPRAPARARRVAYPRVARRPALRLFARPLSVLLTGLPLEPRDSRGNGRLSWLPPSGGRTNRLTVNILGIWDGHDSGAALLQNGRLRFAV